MLEEGDVDHGGEVSRSDERCGLQDEISGVGDVEYVDGSTGGR